MAVWMAIGLSVAGACSLAALAVLWARRSRATRAELDASRQAMASLQAVVADLQEQVDRQERELAVRPDSALVITSLGTDETDRPESTIVLRPTVGERLALGAEAGLSHFLSRPESGPILLRRVVDRGAIRLVALGFGVAHALRPETRDRIEFASRAEMRRSRRRREQEIRLARRLIRSGRVVNSEER